MSHPRPASRGEPETDNRARILAAIEHLDHVLPGQAPLQDFVHHNTLHGFQHLPFSEALAQAHRLNGAACYLSPEQFRAYYRRGRIERRDLVQVLDGETALAPGEHLAWRWLPRSLPVTLPVRSTRLPVMRWPPSLDAMPTFSGPASGRL